MSLEPRENLNNSLVPCCSSGQAIKIKKKEFFVRVYRKVNNWVGKLMLANCVAYPLKVYYYSRHKSRRDSMEQIKSHFSDSPRIISFPNELNGLINGIKCWSIICCVCIEQEWALIAIYWAMHVQQERKCARLSSHIPAFNVKLFSTKNKISILLRFISEIFK